MYRVVTNIQIQQVPSKDAFPNRKATLGFDFVHTYESSDSWRDLTNNGKLVLPKNLYFKDQSGTLRPLHGTNINVGGFSSAAPLILRGDKVVIVAGYKYFESQNAQRETTKTAQIFEGYVSKVTSAQPIEMELEDQMWLFKQTPVDTKTFTASDTLEDIMQFLIDKVNAQWGTNYTVNALTNTNFGTFAIGNESAAQVLARLQRKYGFEFYFRNNQLRGGVIIYVESEATTQNFTFQQNIIEDDLEYVRKDDLTLSAIARNTITIGTGKLTKDGKEKSKHKRIEVLVTLRNDKTTIKEIKTGDTVPENDEGERKTFFFPGATTVNQLADLALDKLKVYYYTGLRGTITTFGLPFVRMGDNARIKDDELPERNGVYKIRKVEYSGGINGLRQKITLDFKLNGVV